MFSFSFEIQFIWNDAAALDASVECNRRRLKRVGNPRFYREAIQVFFSNHRDPSGAHTFLSTPVFGSEERPEHESAVT